MEESGGDGDDANLAALHVEDLRAACRRNSRFLRLDDCRHENKADDQQHTPLHSHR